MKINLTIPKNVFSDTYFSLWLLFVSLEHP